MSLGGSSIHHLDPRPKIIATVLFIVAVVSGPKHGPILLLFYLPWPLGVLIAARLSFGPFIKRILILFPFVIFMALFNPFFEKGRVLCSPFGLEITEEGLLTTVTVMVKFILCMWALLLLMATTRFMRLVAGFRKLGMPEFIAIQISLIYRYLALLLEQAGRMIRARAARLGSMGSKMMMLRSTGGVIGVLFLRTLDRGERVYLAMLLKGFRKRLRNKENMDIGFSEVMFSVASFVLILVSWWLVQGRDLWRN